MLSVTFSKDDIAKLIQNLNPNKAHGHGQISIRMLKLCSNSICKPLEIIFNRCLETSTFPNDWKKGNVVPVFKKGDKQILKNYRPISLLPVCGKIFEKLILNEMFKFFIENDLILLNQSGFKPGDSCINQLLFIIHDIYKSFDCAYEVRGVFLIFRKCLTKCGMMVSYLNWNKMAYLEITQTFTSLLSKQKTKGSIEWASLLVEQC